MIKLSEKEWGNWHDSDMIAVSECANMRRDMFDRINPWFKVEKKVDWIIDSLDKIVAYLNEKNA